MMQQQCKHGYNGGTCMSCIFGYIRDEIAYAQRRYEESTEPYEQAKWSTRWQALHDVGTAAGMVNLPLPGGTPT